MGFFFRVKAVLGWSGRRGRVAAELARRGATRELVRFTEPFGADVITAWSRCPRGAWSLEMAARFGVETALVARATADLVAAAGEPDLAAHSADPREWGAQPALQRSGVAPGPLAEGEAAAKALVAEDALERFCVAAEALCFAIVDAQRPVREARQKVEEAQRWGRFDDMLEASERYDEAYAAAHMGLADLVRRRIPGDLVRAAALGVGGYPYR